MLHDYLRSFWRGVLQNKVATFINVGGLALGFTVFFALSFYVYREFSWDAHWEDANRIFTASGVQENAAGTSPALITTAPYVLGTNLLERHPEAFETYARVHSTASRISIDGIEYPFMNHSHVEPSLLDIIQLETLEGSFADVFADPRAIAINVLSAERFFADKPALGKTITFMPNTGSQDAPMDFIIKAVFALPEPSTFATMQMIAVLDASATPLPGFRLDLWQFQPPPRPPQPGEQFRPEQPFPVSHYFKLREGIDSSALEVDLRAHMDENRFMDTGNSKVRFVFRNVQDLHLAPSFMTVGDNVQRLWVYATIGALVLLISGCNFVMLATLRLVDRMREVGVRKSVGAGTGQLLRQYLFDAFLHTLLAASLAVLFLGFAFPKLSVMLQTPLRFDLLTPQNLALCLMMVILFTLISSLYPAWLSSQVRPGPLLRNGAGAVVGTGTTLRKLLVALQFAIVVVLLLASAVIRQQIDYTRTRDRGYSTENLITAQFSGGADIFSRLPAIIAEFRRVPGVEAAATGVLAPGLLIGTTPQLVRTLAADGSTREGGLHQRTVGTDFFRVMSVPILAGREFSELDGQFGSPEGSTATSPRNVIVNAAAARILGFASAEAALEQLLEVELSTPDRQVRKQSLRVIGVVADTQFMSPMMPPLPEMYMLTPQGFVASIKVREGENVMDVTEDLKKAWDTVMNGATPFIPRDLGSAANFQLQREEYEARIITGATMLAIVIALLGLYGLVAATVIKRVKEIGVRKVMGAGRQSIVTLFLWQFSKPIVVANVVAWPFGFWAIRQWLQRFPFQLDTGAIMLAGLAASIAALLIAWMTVGVMAARAASVNPVLALRYE